MRIKPFAGALTLAFVTTCAPHPAAAQATCDTINAAGHCVPGADTVVRGPATDRGASVGTSATTLMPANAARRGIAIQNQSASADCYISGQGAASADWHSLKIPGGGYYETPNTHSGTGAISIVCTAASTPVHAREW